MLMRTEYGFAKLISEENAFRQRKRIKDNINRCGRISDSAASVVLQKIPSCEIKALCKNVRLPFSSIDMEETGLVCQRYFCLEKRGSRLLLESPVR